MLAYVFWHWPTPDTDQQTYEAALSEFQDVLNAHKPAGFLESAVFRLSGASWLPPNITSYEDWYVVEGSCSLDLLNDAAVTAPRKETHDRAARRAAGGTAGLYRLRKGQVLLSSSHFARWFSKPAGMSYDVFYEELGPWTRKDGGALWGRQMTLGPTPEFCLRTIDDINLPDNIESQLLSLQAIWPPK